MNPDGNAPATILMVEDAPAAAGLIADRLPRHGHRLLAARGGEEGLRCAAQLLPELILVDGDLPGVNGIEFCRRLKAQPETGAIPVILLISATCPDHRRALFAAGAADYVTKPLLADELSARVALQLRLAARERQVKRQEEELRRYRQQAEALTLRHAAELRESNRRLDLMSFALDQVNEAAYLIDEHGRFFYVNEAAGRAHGYSVEELSALGVPEIDPDWSLERVSAAWKELSERGWATFETRHRRRDGSLYPVEVNSTHVKVEGRTLNLALVRDITERKRAEQELWLLNAAVNASSDAAYLVNERGLFGYVNEAACRSLGYGRDELLAMGPLDIDPDLTRESFERWLRQMFAEGPTRGIVESRHRTRDGRLFPVELLASLIEHGGRKFSLVMARDITARKAAELRLHASEQAFRALAENSPDAVARYDRDCRRLYVNPATARLYGVAPEELLGRTPLDSRHLPEAPRLVEEIRRVFASGEPGALDHCYFNASGEQRWGHSQLAPEFDADGRVVTVLAIGRDVTERKRMETELRRQADFQRMLLDGLNDIGIQLMILEQGRFIYVNNRERAHRFGISDAEIDAGFSLAKYLHPDDRERILNQHRRRLAGEPVPRSFEIRLVTPAGEQRDYEVSTATVPGSDPVRLVAVLNDITESRRAERERQEHMAFLETMDRVNRAIGAAEDTEGMMHSVLDVVLSNLACDRAFLLHPCDPEAAAWSVPLERSRPEHPGAGLRKEPEAMDDSVAHKMRVLLEATGAVQFGTEGAHPLPVRLSAEFGIRSLMAMALRPKLGPTWEFGVLRCNEARGWSRQEERLIEEIGRRLEDGLTSLAAYRNLRESERQFRTLAENMPAGIIRYDRHSRIVYLNPVLEAELGIAAHQLLGRSPAEIGIRELFADYHDLVERVAATGEAGEIEFASVETDGSLRHHHVTVVPERNAAGELVGVLAVGRNITALKEAERRQREAYGLLQELTSRRESAREEEKKRIAREIHDELGQQLTALRMGISTLRLQFGADHPLLTERLHALTGLVDKTIQVVRNTTATLRPAFLDMGLGPAVDCLAKEFEAATGIACELMLEAEHSPLPEATATALFRIVQESLTNIARHAGARQVVITFSRHDQLCTLEIRDDGRGFEVSSVRRKAFGLLGMRERALMLGGELAIDSKPGSGTRLRVRIPLPVGGR